MKKYFLLIFVITLLASSTVVFGQEPNITSEPTKPTSNNPINQADIDQMLMNDFNGQNTFIPGFLGCSDLSTNVSLELSTVNKINSSGVNVDIRGKIKNGNKFPIINGTLLVKIFIKNGSNLEQVDSFIAKEAITLNASSVAPVEFTWKIPAYALSGTYQVVTSFVTDKGFILNDTKSEKQIVTFKVVGEQKTNVRLNTSEIKLNSKIYSTETPLVLKADEKGDLQFTLLNKTAKIQEVPISFKLYKWNDQIKKNLLKTEKKTYLLKPNTSLNIHYVFDDNKFSLYYLHTIVNYKDSKSELVTSLKRDSVLGSKIDFSSIKKYPIEKEKENGLITCFAPVDFFDSGKVTTVIYDQKDNVIWKEEKNISDIDIKNGLFTAFTPNSSSKNIKVETKLFNKDNVLIDENKVEYKCADLTSDCSEPLITGTSKYLYLKIIAIILGILIAISVGLFWQFKMKKKILI